MEGKERLQDYLVAVAGCIRWKRARAPLLRELSDHIEDQKKDFSALGMNEDESMERSINEMGDPVAVGKELDRLHRPKTSWGLIFFTVLAVGLGLLLLPGSAQSPNRMRHVLVLVAAIPVVALLAFWDYPLLIRKTWALVGAYAAVFFYLLLTSRHIDYRGIAPHLVYGALLLPLLFALTLCRLRGKGAVSVLLCSLGAMALSVPALIAPDFTAALVALGAMLLTLGLAVWLGWFKVKRPVGLLCAWGPVLLTLAVLLLRHGAWLGARFAYVLHPELDPLGKGFFTLMVQEFLEGAPWVGPSGGQIFGEYALLLEPAFVPLRLAAAFGKILLPLLILLLLVLAWAVAVRIHKLKSVFGRLVACSAAATLLLQALANLGSCLLPGIASRTSLPFLSYGPAYLLLDLILVGVLLSVFRMDALVRDITEHKSTFTLSIPEQLHIPLGPWDIRINRRE